MKIFSSLWICCQPGLESEFQDSQDYRESLSWKTSKQTSKQTYKQTYKQKRSLFSWAVVAHTCNPSTLRGRDRWISEFEFNLVYRVSPRTARAPQRNPVLKLQKKNKKQQQKKQTKHQKLKCLHFHFPLHSNCICMQIIVSEYFSK